MAAWILSLLVQLHSAHAVVPDAVHGDIGWVDRGERKTDVGKVRLWSQALDEAYCVRAGLTAPATVDRLLAVAEDIPSAPSWSTQDLVQSEVIDATGTTTTYWQYIDVPSWLVVADRYWVVQGQTERLPDQRARFTWSQVPATAHPEVDTKAQALSEGSIRVPVTVGAWVFELRDAGTWTTYTNCADPGGRLPDWVVRFAATRTVPDNLADLVREALARTAD